MVEAFLPITAGIGRYHLMTVKSEFAIQRQPPAARMLAAVQDRAGLHALRPPLAQKQQQVFEPSDAE